MNETGKFELNDTQLLAYSHGEYYTLGKKLGTFGYSVRKQTAGEKKKNKKGKKRYAYKQLYLGPILLEKKDTLFKEKYRKDLNTLKMIVKNIDEGHYWYKLKLKKNIRILKKII